VRKYRRVTRLQEDDAGKQHDERSFQVYYEPDGTMVLHARLPAEKGALVLKAIEMAMDRDTQDEQDVSADMLIRLSSVDTISCVWHLPSISGRVRTPAHARIGD
jgi:hypothetical protein